MLVIGPVLVVVFPHLVKVEGIEEFDCPIISGHNEADVLDVSEFRDGVLGSLFCFQILLASSRCIGTTPFHRLHTHIKTGLLITHSANILKLVLQDRVYLRFFTSVLAILCQGVVLFLRLNI